MVANKKKSLGRSHISAYHVKMLVVVAVLLCSLLGLFFYAIPRYKKQVHVHPMMATQKKTPPIMASSSKRNQQDTLKTASSESAYDFYTMLKESKHDEVVSTPPLSTSSITPALKEYYTLQIASLSRKSDAIRVKDQVALVGFEASIRKNSIGGQNVYRVVLGPYESRNEAEQSQQALEHKFVSSFIVKSKS